eukprot:2910301-Amphidinium_carterae.1
MNRTITRNKLVGGKPVSSMNLLVLARILTDSPVFHLGFALPSLHTVACFECFEGNPDPLISGSEAVEEILTCCGAGLSSIEDSSVAMMAR